MSGDDIFVVLCITVVLGSMGALLGISDNVTPKLYDYAVELCENNEGLDYIDLNILTAHDVTCMNNARFYISNRDMLNNDS